MSADALARAQAIERAVGSGSSSDVVAKAALRPVVNSSRPTDPQTAPQLSAARTMATTDDAARMQAEIEALRLALRQTEMKAEEEVMAYKREAQKRQGEAVGVRKRLEEVCQDSCPDMAND